MEVKLGKMGGMVVIQYYRCGLNVAVGLNTDAGLYSGVGFNLHLNTNVNIK
jgi:hypothetical protein